MTATLLNQAPELQMFPVGLSTVSVGPGVEVVGGDGGGVGVGICAFVCAVSDASFSTHPANLYLYKSHIRHE